MWPNSLLNLILGDIFHELTGKISNGDAFNVFVAMKQSHLF